MRQSVLTQVVRGSRGIEWMDSIGTVGIHQQDIKLNYHVYVILAVSAQTASPSGTRTASIVSAVVIIGILAAGFLIYIPVTTASSFPVAITNTTQNTFLTSSDVPVVSTTQNTFLTSSRIAVVTTTETTFVTSSTTQVPASTTATQAVFTESDLTLASNHYDDYDAPLTVGTDVQVSWSASESVIVYVFNSAEYGAFVSSGTNSPNIATDSAASGTLDFHISGTDTYYLVIENEYHCALGICLGGANIGYTTNGSETYPTTTYLTSTVTYTTSTPTVVTSTSTSTYTTSTPTVVTSTSTSTYTTSTPTVVTSTSTSTTTKSCSFYFWNWLFGAKICS